MNENVTSRRAAVMTQFTKYGVEGIKELKQTFIEQVKNNKEAVAKNSRILAMYQLGLEEQPTNPAILGDIKNLETILQAQEAYVTGAEKGIAICEEVIVSEAVKSGHVPFGRL